MKNKNLIYVIILLLILQAGLFLYFNIDKKNDVETRRGASVLDIRKTSDTKKLPRHYSYFSSLEFFKSAFRAAENDEFKTKKKVYGGILPHHLIVKNKIASFVNALGQYDYDNVILIGPNHFDAGKSDIITSRAIWETPFGELNPNLELIESLGELSEVNINEKPFINEHSISGLVSFIKKAIPEAKFTPIILKENTSEADCEVLLEKLLTVVNPENTLVLASVDFSHYLPVSVADFHDQSSRAIIESFDYARIKQMEIDSPASIYTVLKYLSAIGSEKASLLAHTNSGRMMNDFDNPTTSHNFYYFSKGQASKQKNINMMFFGDLMIDRHVGDRINKHGVDYLFANLAGEENRFFRGIDIISANLEGAVTDEGKHYPPIMSYDFAFHPDRIAELHKYNFNFFNLANNHFSDQGERGIIETRRNLDKLGFFYVGCRDKLVDDCSTKVLDIADLRVGMAGFSMVYGLFDIAKATSSIANLKEKSDLVVVNIHWGVEYNHYANQIQKNIAHSLIDAGADIIIGHHPHVVEGIEVYKNKPIFYSLGNFVFDQYFSRDTQTELGLGVNFDEKELDVDLFPLISKNSQPSLMSGKEKKVEFDDLLKWSDLDKQYIEQIKNGKLKLFIRK